MIRRDTIMSIDVELSQTRFVKKSQSDCYLYFAREKSYRTVPELEFFLEAPLNKIQILNYIFSCYFTQMILVSRLASLTYLRLIITS
jgi:hypothetical protein